ncbi:MAG: hypothetical protein HND47_01845 [Chloroflexi bacterium]|nr:hypothetical protein [Chloroflexota bacterium]
MRVKQILFFILILSLLAACGGNETTDIPAPTVVPSEPPPPTATIIPTSSTPLALLVLPADMDKTSFDLYQKTVYDLAQASGFRFQVRNTLTPQDVADPTLKVVIALPPDPGIASLAPASPTVQFLAVNIPNLTAGGNVSVLAPNTQVELPAFLAGYTLAMLVEEYHIGMLYPDGDANAGAAVNAFNNGMRYFCGLCKRIYFTAIDYPTFLAIPPNEDPGKYGGYANVLINDRDVDALYIYPSLASDDFLTYVGTQGVYLVGTSMPEQRPGGWVMTISPDTVKAIQTSWPSLIAGQGGVNVQSPLGLADVDPDILTPGKLRLVQETLDGLLAGRILTSNP